MGAHLTSEIRFMAVDATHSGAPAEMAGTSGMGEEVREWKELHKE